MQTLILVWITYRTDWSKEVNFSNYSNRFLFFPKCLSLPNYISWVRREVFRYDKEAFNLHHWDFQVEKAKQRLDKWEDKEDQPLLKD